jgi:hypothetical protein
MRLPDWMRARFGPTTYHANGLRSVTVTIEADVTKFLEGMARATEAAKAWQYHERLRSERRQGLAFVREYADQTRRALGLPEREASA